MPLKQNETGIIQKESAEFKEWDRFSEWIQCMCIVTFDLNIGQALEFVYPPQFTPSAQEISNICYMAFPDSNSGCMGDTKFHMRLRTAPDTCKSDDRMSRYKNYNRECLPVTRADSSHYWGFVYFRQRRDADLPRGYFQKSLIILTSLPFFNLFYEILPQIAMKFFSEGKSVLEECCRQIDKWPQLQAGVQLNLPLFDVNYQIHIQKIGVRQTITASGAQDSTQSEITKSLSTKFIASVHELDLFRSLEVFIDHVYTLWELVLIAEPIVVVATSPADCSHMVQTLVSLIAPLEYCAEARPYFTIHDSEFKEFTRNKEKSPQPLLLGVTNPFFMKLLREWPHILKIVDNQTNNFPLFDDITTSKSRKASSNINSIFSTSGISVHDGSTSHLYSKYKPFLKKDKMHIKKILLGMKTKRPEEVQTALLRRNLLELTQSFMIPLERYMASLMPLQKDISPFKSVPNINAFKLDDFLSTLELSGPHLTSSLKGNWKGLYKRFFNSPNFRGWYETRHSELQLTLQDLQLQALSEANLKQWALNKQEVEIVDMILKLKQKLNLCNEKCMTDEEHLSTNKYSEKVEQIKAEIRSIKELLPHDLKNVINI